MADAPLSRAALVGVLCAGLALGAAGCSGQRDTSEGKKIEAAIKRFALSHGPDTCSQLTGRGLISVYGGSDPNPTLTSSRARCIKSSKRFQGAPVDVTFVTIVKPTNAHASVRTLDGKHYYVVALLKLHRRWKIDSVSIQAKPH
jgi:hypothetical protein